MPAPYSDNLYSAEDSDSDTEQDILSPADGYFHASSAGDDASSSHYPSISSVPFVPNVLVEDPSLPHDKAREAEAERLNSISPSNSGSSHPQQQHHYRHHQHRRSVEEDDTLDPHLTPLLPPNRHVPRVRTGSNRHQGEAPPAYSPSSGSSASSGSGSPSASLTTTPSNPGYQTFRELSAAMPLSEQQTLLHHGPESMGGGPPKPHKSLGQRVMSYLNLRRKMRFVLGALVILSLGSTVMSLVSWIYFGYIRKHPTYVPIDLDPLRPPDLTDKPLEWNPLPHCRNTPHKFSKLTTDPLQLDRAKGLSIVEELSQRSYSGRNPHVSGEVVVRPTHANAPTLVLEVISNDENLEVQLEPNERYDEFNIITPLEIEWSAGSAPCIQIRATLWIPLHTATHILHIQTINLDILIKDGLFLSVDDDLELTTVTGNVMAPEPPKDRADVLPYALICPSSKLATTSGDITGWYPLYGLLEIESTSGSVDIDVGLKDGGSVFLDDPADLVIKTLSGDVKARKTYYCALGDTCVFPPRNYAASIETSSGNIDADVAVTLEGRFRSQSGDMKLNLLPSFNAALYRNTYVMLNLETNTKSGDISVNINEPVWFHAPAANDPKRPEDEFPIRKSIHKSVSGDMRLVYPSSWNGRFSAHTISGTQKIRGKGLEITKSGNRFSRVMEGKKGNVYASDMQIDSISGDQDVLIGEEIDKAGQ